MASTMIEKVRLAVQAAEVNGSKYDLTDHYAEAIARAAIAAMREPTDEMIEAAEEEAARRHGFGCQVYYSDMNEAAIDAALEKDDES